MINKNLSQRSKKNINFYMFYNIFLKTMNMHITCNTVLFVYTHNKQIHTYTYINISKIWLEKWWYKWHSSNI